MTLKDWGFIRILTTMDGGTIGNGFDHTAQLIDITDFKTQAINMIIAFRLRLATHTYGGFTARAVEQSFLSSEIFTKDT